MRRGHGNLVEEQIGAEVRANLRERCNATRETATMRWVCAAARHDAEPGTAYGQADSHRWVRVKGDE